MFFTMFQVLFVSFLEAVEIQGKKEELYLQVISFFNNI